MRQERGPSGPLGAGRLTPEDIFAEKTGQADQLFPISATGAFSSRQ